jgi:hypothetical protein
MSISVCYIRHFLVLALVVSACDSGDECGTNADCDDDVYCNGAETCSRGVCLSGAASPCDDLLACTVDSCDEALDQCAHVATDLDGDAHFSPSCGGDDCDDGEATVYPGAPELCDHLDNDCDGDIAEDGDGDGFFDAALCPEGNDCDDGDRTVHPGAVETCDGVDTNCVDGVADEEDTDGDGALDPTCGGDDCDDEDADVSPLATERCNGLDDDCDDEADEGFDCVMGLDYECETACGSTGLAACGTDCTLPDECPFPAETCDGSDEDCDGDIDEDFDCVAGEAATCTTTCGSSGVGTCTATCEAAPPALCVPPVEVCNGVDDNCSGQIDEGFLCAAGATGACTTTCGSTGTGPCSTECEPASPDDCAPPVESCADLVDNDCDGDLDCTDEDCIGDLACGI